MAAPRVWTFWVAALAAMALAGCASGPAPRDHYYRLETAAPARLAKPVIPGAVEIDRVRVEAISQGRRMLYRDAANPGEISQHAYHHWTNPPNVMLQEQLVTYLRVAGAANQVVTPAVHVATDYWVTGRLVRFERMLSGSGASVVVEIELVLTRRSDDELLLLETYREERTTSGPGVSEAVNAYGAATTSIFERFVADIPRS